MSFIIIKVKCLRNAVFLFAIFISRRDNQNWYNTTGIVEHISMLF